MEGFRRRQGKVETCNFGCLRVERNGIGQISASDVVGHPHFIVSHFCYTAQPHQFGDELRGNPLDRLSHPIAIDDANIARNNLH